MFFGAVFPGAAMPLETIGARDAARGQLPRLVNNAIRGGLTLITRFGKPAAYVLPAELIETLAGEPCPEQYDALAALRRAVGGVA